MTLQGDALAMAYQITGARLLLESWDGAVFVAKLMPTGSFVPIIDLGYMTKGFAQFQMDKDGNLNALRLSAENGQTYEFRGE